MVIFGIKLSDCQVPRTAVHKTAGPEKMQIETVTNENFCCEEFD